MTRSGAVSLDGLIEVLKNVPEFPAIWMNPPNSERKSDERLVVSLDFYEKLERDFYRSDEEYDMYANLRTVNSDAVRLSSFDGYLSMHMFGDSEECPEVWVRRGGRSLIPREDSEKFLYTGPAREPITEVPLTRDLLNQIFVDLQEKTRKFWQSNSEDRTLYMEDEFAVTIHFSPRNSMAERQRQEERIREMYQGEISSLPTLSC